VDEFTPDLENDPFLKQLSEAEKEELLKEIAELRRLQTSLRAAEEHVFPARGSVTDLAGRLKMARELAADKRPSEELSPGEHTVRKARVAAVKELDRMYQKATASPDGSNFFHRLWRASLIPEDKISQPVDLTGAAVFAIDELYRTLGSKPSRKQIIDLVENWRHEGDGAACKPVTDRHWARIFEDPFIAAMLRG
jgi:hypothetical protein